MSTVNFNACAHLEIEEIAIKPDENIITKLVNLQQKIQTECYQYDYNLIKSNPILLYNYVNFNFHAIQDELRELLNSFGGVNYNNGEFWKPWKKVNKELQDKSTKSIFYILYELNVHNMLEETDSEKTIRNSVTESYFEIIDILHFLNNLILICKESKLSEINDSIDLFAKSFVGQIPMLKTNNELKLSFDEFYSCTLQDLLSIFISSSHSQKTEGVLDVVFEDEIVSIYKRILKFAYSIGMDNQMIVNMYYSKNKENINRQLNGY